MDWKWRHGAWLGRGALPDDFYDLAIAADDPGDGPPEDAVERLKDASVAALLAEAVRATCEARQAALGWRAGPPLADWSLVELRVDLARRLWVTVHEYETDEYSLWMVRFDLAHRPVAVRRRPWVRIDGDPTQAGDQLSGTP